MRTNLRPANKSHRCEGALMRFTPKPLIVAQNNGG